MSVSFWADCIMLDCTKYPVEDLLPHSPPMVLLGRVLQYDSLSLVAEVFISPDSMFYDAEINGVPAWVGIEYMAQAVSALAGLRAKEKDQEIKLGLLLGTRRLILTHKVLPADRRYHVQVKQIFWDESGLANFDCQVSLDQEVYVEAKINVFEADDIEIIMERNSG